MSHEYLAHHGVKGMKWGVRRYQNKDGTLTPAGKKRMYREMFDADSKSAKERRNYTGDPNRWAKNDLENSKRVADSGKNFSNELRNVNRSSMNRDRNKISNIDLSHMSDKEMRDQINRAMLERQYNDVILSQQNVSRGKERVDRILETSAAVLGVTSSALAIALAIRDLKS